MNEQTQHAFLELEQYGVSNTEAKKILIKTLLDNGVRSPKGGWERATFDISRNGATNKVSFRELLADVKANGYESVSQSNADNRDEIFGGMFGITTPTMGFLKIESTYAGHTKSLTPPMTNIPVEMALSEDILFYREEACMYSDEYDFVMCTRYYRAYLTACISLVDAFINRHILIYNHSGIKSPVLDELKVTSRLEDRLNLFMAYSAGGSLNDINEGNQWTQFKALRRLRNEMTHINEPSLGYSIHEFAEHLNYVKKGIGGLLKLIRNKQGKPSLAFIERLYYAPLVYFNEITHKEDGNHIIKRRR